MHIGFWFIFNAIIIILVALDLTVWNRGGRVISFKSALLSTACWIALAVGFAAFIYWAPLSLQHVMHQELGRTKALEFITGYLLEEALSVDNLFVFLLLFAYFKVPAEQERTILLWGIVGALIMRGTFIFAGVALVHRFHWLIYAFGVFLVWTGFGLLRKGEDVQVDPSHNIALRLTRKIFPVTHQFEGNRFFVRNREGKLFATPLFIVLLVVETTDILFATDSIPAILAISRDSFIVYTSNVFAILGLRSLFFALSGLMKLFHYLHYGLAVILMFIGAKMLVSAKYQIPIWVALSVIAGLLLLSVAASIAFPRKEKH
jgi:TerC family integral membrane protein